MAFGLMTLPILLIAYFVYQQYDSNDPEGRVTNVKVSGFHLSSFHCFNYLTK